MHNNRPGLYIRILSLFAVLTIIGIISWRYVPQLYAIAKEPVLFRDLLLAYGALSQVVFVVLQVLQVVVAPLPGEIIQVAGGYIYGTVAGTALSLLGITLGSIIAFFITRWLGYPLLSIFIKPEKLEHFRTMLNSNRAEIAIFIIFLIPGAPKDILTFVAGITPIQPGHFLLAAMLGRFPGILVSAVIGAQLEHHQYLEAAIFSLAAAFLCLLGFMYGNRLLAFLRHKQA